MNKHRGTSRLAGLLSIALLPAILAGCSTSRTQNTAQTQPTPSTSVNTTADNSIGGGGANPATGVPSNQMTSTSSSSIGNTTDNSSLDTANSTGVPTPAPTAQSPHVILYSPTVWALNTVRVSGRVFGRSGSDKVTVLAKYQGTGQIVAEAHVFLADDGTFAATLPISATDGPLLLTFEATYPGASAAGVTRYFSTVAMDGTTPAVMSDTRQTIDQMGANFPVWLPTWLPQTLTASQTTMPGYSTTVAAKSFNYIVQVFHTEKRFPVNNPAIRQTPDQELANVDGTHFQSAAAARKQLMRQANQSLPNASMSSTSVNLIGHLDATVYADTWHSVVWHEGEWLMVVRGPSAQQNISEAKHAAQILNSVYLPPTHGVLWIRNISAGSNPTGTPHTAVSFVEGNNLYDVWSQGSIYTPLVLASSMKS